MQKDFSYYYTIYWKRSILLLSSLTNLCEPQENYACLSNGLFVVHWAQIHDESLVANTHRGLTSTLHLGKAIDWAFYFLYCDLACVPSLSQALHDRSWFHSSANGLKSAPSNQNCTNRILICIYAIWSEFYDLETAFAWKKKKTGTMDNKFNYKKQPLLCLSRAQFMLLPDLHLLDCNSF